MTAVAATGLVPLQAPLPPVRQGGLLSVATVTEPRDTHWLTGAWSGGDPPGPAFIHRACSTGSDKLKTGPGEIGSQRSSAFTVYLPAGCTAASIGVNPRDFLDRLRLVFERYEEQAVEQAFVNGQGNNSPYLGDANMLLLYVGVVDSLAALRLLENELARKGGGFIHAAPSTVIAWDALRLTQVRNGITYSSRGTPIVVGAGYIDALPDGAPMLEPGQQWAFATGAVEVLRESQITTTPPNYSEAFDRAMNDVIYIAERPYVFNWLGRTSPSDRDHVQAGVLVDETLRLGIIDGGTCDQ